MEQFDAKRMDGIDTVAGIGCAVIRSSAGKIWAIWTEAGNVDIGEVLGGRDISYDATFHG